MRYKVDESNYIVLTGALNDETTHLIQYSKSRNTFILGKNEIVKEFNFSDNKCYLKVLLKNVQENGAIRISKINNTNITKSGKDNSAPQFSVNALSGSYAIGTEITTNKCSLVDVLIPALSENIVVSVFDPNGNTVKDKTNREIKNVLASEEYTFVIEQAGEYNILYTIINRSDVRKSNSTTNFVVIGANNYASSITFEGISKNQMAVGKLNENYTILNCVIKENGTEYTEINDRIQYVVYYNEFTMVSIGTNKFTPTKNGVYTIYAYYINECGYSTYNSYQLLVE